jgi:2-oxoglutarate ferredoxin oxidoreductase subunit alpha
MADGTLEKHNMHLSHKYRLMDQEVKWDLDRQDDSELLVVAYGSSARAAQASVREAREAGMRVELLRPQTLYPFPSQAVQSAARRSGRVLVVEMSLGQMVEDVRLAVEGAVPVEFLGRPGGAVPTPAEILAAMLKTAPRSTEQKHRIAHAPAPKGARKAHKKGRVKA